MTYSIWDGGGLSGSSRSRGLVVVTGNLSEFTRVDGLRCEDWLDPVQ
jgi:tRNA(fMet)-specific endonuclease VapC